MQLRKNNAIDLMVMMVVDELAEDMGINPTQLLLGFVTSRTGMLLYDESSKLWWDGPSGIAEMYKKEITAEKTNKMRLYDRIFVDKQIYMSIM